MNKPDKCVGCPLYTVPGPVWGEGPKQAEFVIIGQNPGPQEIEQMRPFVGPSGNVLNRTLQKTGISRASSYVTNVVKCFTKPGTPVPPAAVRHCKQAFFEEELNALPNVRVVLTLGQEAFNSLCTPKHLALVHVRKGASKDPSVWLAGAPYHHPRGFVVVGAAHPAFIARTGFALQPKFDNQIMQAKRVLDEGAPTQNDVRFNYNPSTVEVQEFIEFASHQPACGVDIEHPRDIKEVEEDEADAFETPITVIGLAATARDVIGIEPDHFPLLKDFFTVPKPQRPRLWSYNGATDFYHLSNLYGDLGGFRLADALLAFHLLYPDERSKDLGTMMSMYTLWGYHKNLETRDPIWYNTADTIGCLEGGERMFEELGSFPINMKPLFFTLCDIILDVKKWKTVGTPYDQAKSDRFEVMCASALHKYDEFWRSKFPMVDWASPKQLVKFFEVLGHKAPLKNRKRKDGTTYKSPSMDEDALEKIAAKGVSTAKLIILMRQLKKSSDFCNLAVDGRFRCRAKIHGQAGGRVQTVDQNVQQIPEEMLVKYDTQKQPIPGTGIFPRETIIPEHEDDLIIAADFSQIEFWLYAHYAKSKKLLAIKERGEYLYGQFYEDIWGESFFLPGVPRTKGNRDDAHTPPWKLLVAKSWPLGFIYGRGVPGVEGLPIDTRKAKYIRERFLSENPEIPRFHNDIMFKARKQGFLQTDFGRMRRFANPEAQRNSLLAFPGQSTACDILIRHVIIDAGRGIKRLFGDRSRLYFTVHDSGIFNGHGARRDPRLGLRQAFFIKQEMEKPIPELGGFYIPAEVKIGPNWGKLMSLEKFAKENNVDITEVASTTAGGV